MEKLIGANDLAENNNVKDEDAQTPIQNQLRQKINDMGQISMTADVHVISLYGHTALAASVINALNGRIMADCTKVNIKQGCGLGV